MKKLRSGCLIACSHFLVLLFVLTSCGGESRDAADPERGESVTLAAKSQAGEVSSTAVPVVGFPAVTSSGIVASEGVLSLASGNVPRAQCAADHTDADAVLASAARHYQKGSYSEAKACAEIAIDLIPQAVEAQHLLAAALSALGRYQEAQVAFAMALLLDPDDPETLADVADFYINVLLPKRRQTVVIGLEYARRGGQGAIARRRSDNELRARLLLLEAEALSDLNQPDLALPRVSEALLLAPNLPGARVEYALVLFRLLRFEESEAALLEVLSTAPDAARAHYHLGLIYERKKRFSDAEAHFLRARRLSPKEFFAPTLLPADEFEKEVKLAIFELAAPLQTLLGEAKLELADLPQLRDLKASSPPFAPTILGLFRGLPAGIEAGDKQERVVILYRVNIGRSASTRAELNRQIRKTLRHELGHLEGYDEDELRRLGLE